MHPSLFSKSLLRPGSNISRHMAPDFQESSFRTLIPTTAFPWTSTSQAGLDSRSKQPPGTDPPEPVGRATLQLQTDEVCTSYEQEVCTSYEQTQPVASDTDRADHQAGVWNHISSTGCRSSQSPCLGGGSWAGQRRSDSYGPGRGLLDRATNNMSARGAPRVTTPA